MTNDTRILLCILFTAAAALPVQAEKEKKTVTFLNQQLGKTEEQMTADWGSGIQLLPDGRKRLVVQGEPIFRSSPGQPGYTKLENNGTGGPPGEHLS
jgi:hypothetical protein